MNAQITGFANSLKELTAKFESIVESLETESREPKREYLTFAETCKYLGVTRASLYNMTSRKQIPHYKPNGKSLFFKESDLVAWIESKRVKTADEIESEAVNLIVH
ncbi:MAG: helix-turn-helix domain-containing protein [Paludibacteraceae bacterium]|nr:helix-turn-helix domain-containing protein [Paludibacteraceae bacterium]